MAWPLKSGEWWPWKEQWDTRVSQKIINRKNWPRPSEHRIFRPISSSSLDFLLLTFRFLLSHHVTAVRRSDMFKGQSSLGRASKKKERYDRVRSRSLKFQLKDRRVTWGRKTIEIGHRWCQCWRWELTQLDSASIGARINSGQ